MMSMTCHNLEVGNFVVCGCSSDRFSKRNKANGVLRNKTWSLQTKTPQSFFHGNIILFFSYHSNLHKLFYYKCPCVCILKIEYLRLRQSLMYIGIGVGPLSVLDMTKGPKSHCSLSDMFEVVADDLLILNKNLQSVIKDFASGEIKQASSLFDCNVQLDEYLTKSYHKTASLIAASTKGAAIFSRVNSEITEQMYEYGKNLGLSFQVVDDILDFTQSTEQLGKPAGSDLAKGYLTAPVLFALEKEPKLKDIIETKFCETGSLEEAIHMIKNCGGIERAQELAKEKADQAVKNLQCLPSSSFRLALEQMVRYNLERVK
ncbi:All-trans-nonaprenyl-diphosphate synthase (geranylgeranyl-diphosphate specific) [Handroanthus impetiginosus]|uniref:All-trans-nonaprenyl-diphosphate synthase (Geranylgeranyl-diphosphate specific) n=1 Tax=Handroanthus impetiginosus TaxID=429701 RepID=A0A2G9G967_9LAMI|nr:All-trans-nonaprenyl-diphosphate synthase (geranylgeranyl-diphosphate specific) [Handroanthus impetiginosus]